MSDIMGPERLARLLRETTDPTNRDPVSGQARSMMQSVSEELERVDRATAKAAKRGGKAKGSVTITISVEAKDTGKMALPCTHTVKVSSKAPGLPSVERMAWLSLEDDGTPILGSEPKQEEMFTAHEGGAGNGEKAKRKAN